MKRSSKYVGLEVHQATSVTTVRDDGGRVLLAAPCSLECYAIAADCVRQVGDNYAVAAVVDRCVYRKWAGDLQLRGSYSKAVPSHPRDASGGPKSRP